MIIVGAGRIGQALSNYKLFNDRNITVTALFDIKEGLVGSEVGKPGRKKPVLHIDQLDAYLQENPDIKIALLTVPEEAAQETMDKLIGHGVKGIVNFAPKILKVPKEIPRCPGEQRLHRHLALSDRLPAVSQKIVATW